LGEQALNPTIVITFKESNPHSPSTNIHLDPILHMFNKDLNIVKPFFVQTHELITIPSSSRTPRSMALSKDKYGIIPKLYDTMEDLGRLRLTRTRKQLSTMAPNVKAPSSTFMICKPTRHAKVHDIAMSHDSRAPTIDKITGGALVHGVNLIWC
jgi:hypothetical protein